MDLKAEITTHWEVGQKLEARGELSEAEVVYHKLLQLQPNFHPAWHALGLLAVRAGQLSRAAEYIEKALALNEQAGLYWRNLGEIHRRIGRLDKAEICGKRATALLPKDVDAHYNLALVYTDSKHYDSAIASYKRALELNSAHGLSWNNLGSAFEQRSQGINKQEGDKEAARDAYVRAVTINPQHAEAQNNLGAIFSELGELDSARRCFEAAIAARPDFVEPHYNYCSLHKYTRDDVHLAHLKAIYVKREQLAESARVRCCFAFGKALDDIGEYDRAFAVYAEGNRLQHALIPYDEAQADALLERLIAVFDELFFSDRRSWKPRNSDERVPIFIVGMPRSGTTLLEQILSSHPSVYGAGELRDLSASIDDVINTMGSPDNYFCEKIALLNEDDIKRIGDEYLQRVWQLSPDSRYITDKMPANFFYLGLIHLALPQAKIIHAKRDPMDSCFSCYSRLFNDTMAFAYDLENLGRYYVRYARLMAHWHRVLPAGTILDLSYEDMVADTETQARRVLKFVGLPWDSHCLNFHENTRPVKTASVAQVRRPIYQSSIARWKYFASHLRPLYALVKDWRVDNDGNIKQDAEEFFSQPSAPQQNIEAIYSAALTHYRADRFEQAIELFDNALAHQPESPAILNSKGFALQDLGHTEAAHDCFVRAVTLAPGFAMARLNLALAQLKLGHWEEGWANYESRWEGSAEAGDKKFARPLCPLPQWEGQSNTAQQSILIITEQGFGDAFQFCRYLPLLCERFARVGFACSAPTLRLMENSFGDRIVCMTEMPRDFSDWDWHSPLMSLPRAFATRITTVPSNLPYLRVHEPARMYWRDRLQRVAPHRLRIGLAWAGRSAYRYNARRSFDFSLLSDLLCDKRVTWFSLQKWLPEESVANIPEGVEFYDWTAELSDFATTAALVDNLDLVISVDSVIVHLAGALNVPTWMLDRFDNEWRWLNQRFDSPWYPQLRIFRQSRFGAWPDVIDDVKKALNALPLMREMVSHSSSQNIEERSVRKPISYSSEQALQIAARLNNSGRNEEAERVLRNLLQSQEQSKQAQALHLLGIVRFQRGDIAEAVELIEKAITREPNNALFHANFAEMQRLNGAIDAAIKHGETAVSLDSTLPSAHSNLGLAYYDAKNYALAENCHRRALELQPQLVQSLNNLGSIERALKHPDLAIEWYKKAIECQPDYVESLSNLGAVFLEQDRLEEADQILEHALVLNANSADVLCNLGLVRLKQHRVDEAFRCIQNALALRTDYIEALIGLGRCYSEIDRTDMASTTLQRATDIAPHNAEAWCQYALVTAEIGNMAAAEIAFNHTLQLNPDMADALVGLANMRLEAGEGKEAENLLNNAIAKEPDHFGARFHLAQARKVLPGDSNLSVLEALAAREAGNSDKRISLNYALGKAYDDLGDYARAFRYFSEGARLKRAQFNYDADADAARIDRTIALLDKNFLDKLSGAGNPSQVPIFVLGMPRSGTTLTEQIIASHPQVFGSGELRDLLNVVQQPLYGALPYPDNLKYLTTDDCYRLGSEYLAKITALSLATRVTDKMPINYIALGLIRVLLPNAKIIHVKRNAIDTCLSCFTRLFNRHQEATYDLYELGRHYAGYARIMEHWQAILPAQSFYEVEYEALINNTEFESRRLIDYCGLTWDSDCLEFHTTKRNIRTASVTQVRQPIYKSSIKRWRHYEEFLGPLIKGLGKYAPND